jgi:hypothetical protein
MEIGNIKLGNIVRNEMEETFVLQPNPAEGPSGPGPKMLKLCQTISEHLLEAIELK